MFSKCSNPCYFLKYLFNSRFFSFLLLFLVIYFLIILTMKKCVTENNCRSEFPLLYEYYIKNNDVFEGLRAPRNGFTLNKLPITLYSGSMHYFRIHPDYWRDRLRKARAAGLNAIETYIPWNLHEPQSNLFDFGNGNNDLSIFLDLEKFFLTAKEEDLFVILRPGPYICAEWEFGGLPSWILRHEGIKVRTSDAIYLGYVRRYFNRILPIIKNFTFLNGGPIIALQIENEYGSFGNKTSKTDKKYLEFLKSEYQRHNIHELFFTSDSPLANGMKGSIPGVLQTANLATNVNKHFEKLLKFQPERSLMVMEFWTGWFDHWMQPIHSTGLQPQALAAVLATILSYNASVNFYMFVGGTSFGFMNGANIRPKFPVYEPDISSYDYGAPISESGDYTMKYKIIKTLIALDNKIKTYIPSEPPETYKTKYEKQPIKEYIPILDLLKEIPPEDYTIIKSIGNNSNMENMPFNNGSGQSYGIIVYRKYFQSEAESVTLEIEGHVRDIAMVLINGEQITLAPKDYASLLGFGYWYNNKSSLEINNIKVGETTQLDILVENMGRVNFGTPEAFHQKKGLWEGKVCLNGVELFDWEVFALQFKGSWIKGLKGWRHLPSTMMPNGPVILKTHLHVTDEPTDTFVNMEKWKKGCLFINGFPLGRYFYLGPQITNYVPAPLLTKGENEVVVFEHYKPHKYLEFSEKAYLSLRN